jgi:hypothetical protein
MRLDTHKRDRDVIIARLEFQRAQEETRRTELQLAELDAEAGLSRRSRNSTQASSLHSGGRSVASGAHRSHQRLSLDEDRTIGVALAEVTEVDEGQVVVAQDDSHATTQFHSIQETSSCESQHEMSSTLIVQPTVRNTHNDARPANPDDDALGLTTCNFHVSVGCLQGAQCPYLHPDNARMMNRRLVTRSRADAPFHSVDDVRSQGSMSVGNLSSADPEVTRTNVARKTRATD